MAIRPTECRKIKDDLHEKTDEEFVIKSNQCIDIKPFGQIEVEFECLWLKFIE